MDKFIHLIGSKGDFKEVILRDWAIEGSMWKVKFGDEEIAGFLVSVEVNRLRGID